MSPLNPFQVRRVASAFASIDRLLRDAERLVQAQASPFARERPDLTAAESRMLVATIARARERMVASLDHLGVPRPARDLSSRWGVETALSFADVALSDVNARTLAGYGALDAGAASELAAVVSELRDAILRGREQLRPREGEELRARLATLEGPLGEVLRGLEAFSAERGLAELRSLIAAAADRAGADAVEIGIFGRVSSGKSSLINALVGEPILPVGATPVTAVPLRLMHGPSERRVAFTDGRAAVIDAGEFTGFATEAGNPENVKGVRSLQIQSPEMPEGLVLLDTPGVGSLRESGPAQAFAWLPRCDLGIVLAAAGSPLGRDELALVNVLASAGIAAQVLMSKADLLSGADRAEAVAYLAEELRREVEGDVPVTPVSVVGPDRALLDAWRERELVPLIVSRHQRHVASQARRVRALLGAANAAVAGRRGLDRSALDLQKRRLAARDEIRLAVDALESSTSVALAEASVRTVAAWRAGADPAAAARIAIVEPALRALATCRRAADALSEGAGAEAPDDHGARLPPRFDPSLLDALPVAGHRGLLGRLAPAVAARARLRGLAAPLAEAYAGYAQRVRAWALARVEDQYSHAGEAAHPGDAEVDPALRALSALVDEHFPPDATRVDAGG